MVQILEVQKVLAHLWEAHTIPCYKEHFKNKYLNGLK